MRLLSVLIASTLSISLAHAEVYRYTDENGNVVYTDEPREEAERIKVREIPTVNLPDVPLTPEALTREEEAEEPVRTEPYDLVGFSEPDNNSAFWSGSGNVALAVEATPPLRENHAFEVLVDGEPIGVDPSGLFTVQHMDRGTHTATVRVIDSDQNVVQTGQSITFTVHRPSVQN